MSEPSAINGASVLVTGGTGFIGSHLVDHLLERGCRVHCLVRPTSNLQWLDPSRVQLHVGDLHQPETYRDCLSEVDYVFHSAGITRARKRSEYIHHNARGCIPFYQSLVESGQRFKAVIHISSLAAVGPTQPNEKVDEDTPCHPVTYYGKSKLTGEEIALGYASELPVVVLRPPVVFGERERSFFQYIKAISWGVAVKIGLGPRYLSLIYVKDLVRAMVCAAEAPDPEKNIFFTTDGQVYSWDEVGRAVMKALGKRARSVVIPMSLMGFIAMTSEFIAQMRDRAPLLDRQRMIDLRQSSWTASPEKFFEHYSFKPQLTLEQALVQTCAWYKEQKKL
ncbi:MAG: NAD-dependent epimerase/dehydratase family protein [Nitrospinaceae bacterium]|nr:NAD-dependent epimerase/dehydratase family protein [Nitrospinaceae bacterium]NIU98679.1 NAD-dependent epimerase/dehydratase family protein [Nitrospinaceae bacterium]NIW61228.1 NAD-dependent epimerase/dehydratase family protein [Nitrospinaceae bacterium]